MIRKWENDEKDFNYWFLFLTFWGENGGGKYHKNITGISRFYHAGFLIMGQVIDASKSVKKARMRGEFSPFTNKDSGY